MADATNQPARSAVAGRSAATAAGVEHPQTLMRVRSRGARARAAAAEAEDGLLLLTAACEMRIKNAILVGSIRDGVEFSIEGYAAEAAAALLDLADQADTSSRRFAAVRDAARRTRGRGTHVHDYRRVDVQNLTHKEAVGLAVAEELRNRSSNDALLRDLVERARTSAWEEMASALQSRLGALHQFEQPAPASDRAAQLTALRQDIDECQRTRASKVAAASAHDHGAKDPTDR